MLLKFVLIYLIIVIYKIFLVPMFDQFSSKVPKSCSSDPNIQKLIAGGCDKHVNCVINTTIGMNHFTSSNHKNRVTEFSRISLIICAAVILCPTCVFYLLLFLWNLLEILTIHQVQ